MNDVIDDGANKPVPRCLRHTTHFLAPQGPCPMPIGGTLPPLKMPKVWLLGPCSWNPTNPAPAEPAETQSR